MEIIRVQDVRDYLEEGRKDNGKLTQEDLDYMVDRLVYAIESEEFYYGLSYDDILDVGVEELLDAAEGKLYHLGQIWMGSTTNGRMTRQNGSCRRVGGM